MKKILIVGITGLILTVSAVTVMAQNQPVEDKVEIRESKPLSHVNNHKPFKENVSEKTFNKLMNAWEGAKEKVLNQILNDGDAAEDNWSIVSITDIDLELTNQLTAVESSSFNAALFSDEKEQHTEAGDTMPALLLKESKDRAILIWVKPNGDTIAIDIKSKTDNNLRKWFVDGEAHRLK